MKAISEKYVIIEEIDHVKIRKNIRIIISNELNLNILDQTKILTSISELTRNILKYAKKGELFFENITKNNKIGLKFTFIDEGPGIPNIDLALTDGYSTSGGLGKGLSGTKILMDEFSIKSEPGKGTEVVIIKWIV